MFLARRPSPEQIDRFLRESRDLPLSYSPTGIVKGDSVREGIDETTVVVGSFNVDWRKVTEVPSHILPKRQECRD